MTTDILIVDVLCCHIIYLNLRFSYNVMSNKMAYFTDVKERGASGNSLKQLIV